MSYEYLNQNEEALKDLKMSLELLEEIQLTGDIFFPKNWLNATVGRYTSEEAYQIRETFLEANPDLNQVLKNKLYQATDDLDRLHQRRSKIK